MNIILVKIINSLLAGALVFLGALTSGEITEQGALAALIAAGVVAITQFRDFWNEYEEQCTKPKLFSFMKF
jgi:hypothetical protein